MNVTIYTSDLPQDECLRRLRAQPKRRFWTRLPEGTVSAKVRGNRFRLFASGPPYLKNFCAPFFYGHLEQASGKARIQGRFSMHLMVRTFLFLWFGGLAAATGLMLFLPSSAWRVGQRPPVIALLAPAVVGLLGLGFVLFGRRLGRGQTETLKVFLTRELQAHPEEAREDKRRLLN